MSRIPAYPRSTALRSGSEGRRLFGGRKESSPQLRAPPRSFGVRPRTTPLLVFILEFSVSLPLLDSVASVYGGAHPLVMDARRGNVRGSNANALDPVRLITDGLFHPFARNIPAVGKRGNGGDAPYGLVVLSKIPTNLSICVINSESAEGVSLSACNRFE